MCRCLSTLLEKLSSQRLGRCAARLDGLGAVNVLFRHMDTAIFFEQSDLIVPAVVRFMLKQDKSSDVEC